MPLSLDLHSLATAYKNGLRPSALVDEVDARIMARGEDGVWISRLQKDALLARAAELERTGPSADQPLWGIPFAVKDNIDTAGLPTTAGCPGFRYQPEHSARVVDKLLAAGAILIGKTNLDQFATGLVGVRSPYGIARNPFNPAYIPGGSSSGSAVAVSAGLVSFALGTDTAGSGRVPAGFNNIVGLKPSIGLLSATGMVPACRALDCISIFALTVADAGRVLSAAAGYDSHDAYSRNAPPGWQAAAAPLHKGFRFGIPQSAQLKFYGNDDAAALFQAAIERMKRLGGQAVEIDYAPFAEAAALLYTPAGTAERTASIGAFMAEQPDALHPITKKVVEAGLVASGVDVHRLYYKIQELRQVTAPVWDRIDTLMLPTSGTVYKIDEVAAEPILLNSNLGYYTNFVNYFDLSALAVPNGFQANGLPAGITLVGPCFTEARLAGIGEAFHQDAALTLGATGAAMPRVPAGSASMPRFPEIAVAVFGAHMRGLPLNSQLVELGGRFLETCRTASDYRAYALPGPLPRPGLVRVAAGGINFEGEIWALPSAAFGAFVASIPSPLGIADVVLDDGRIVKGFVCEAIAAADAEDISDFAGWRPWLAAKRERPHRVLAGVR